MTNSRQGCRGPARWLIPASAGLLLPLVGACRGEPQAPAPTAPPPFAERVETVPRAQVLDYASRLVFDTSVAASDAQHLLLRRGDATVVGPFAQIAPERGAASLSEAQLWSGRIIARVSVSDSYPLLGFPRGVSYLWADSAPSGRRWVIVPTNLAERLRTVPLGYERDSLGVRHLCRPSRAVWGTYPGPQGAGRPPWWVCCTTYGCCCSGGPCEGHTINPGGPFPPPREWPSPEFLGAPPMPPS